MMRAVFLCLLKKIAKLLVLLPYSCWRLCINLSVYGLALLFATELKICAKLYHNPGMKIIGMSYFTYILWRLL